MELESQIRRLAALAHPGRLQVFRLLVGRAPQSVRPADMLESLDLKPNTLSVYLGALADAGLVEATRDGTRLFYRARLQAMGSLVDFLVADCCRGRPDLCATKTSAFLTLGNTFMHDKSYSVLFICTGNSARSIFAEALLRDEGGARFKVHSAGIRPQSELNPFALEVLERNGHDVSQLRAKHISEFQGPDAPALDFVFTVCDRAAAEECPAWSGQPVSAHWGLKDPVKVDGTDAEKAYAFAETYAQMRRRVIAFAALPFESLDRISLQKQVDEIGAPETAGMS
jgi:protein-tyrosine-phosphatase/DNA-binding transcriptional ArsR family regulator